jgi:hypothetical protein
MNEAFEIGISLALADGVSEGIAKAERDAAAVTRAASVGALAVERLQRAGVAALTVMGSTTLMPKAVNPAEFARNAPGPAASAGSAEGVEVAAASAGRDRLGPLTPPPAAAPQAPTWAPVGGSEAVAPAKAELPDARQAVAAQVARVDVTHLVRLHREAGSAGPQGALARPMSTEGPGAASPIVISPPLVVPSGEVYGGGRAAPVSVGPAVGGGAGLRLDHYAGRRLEAFSLPEEQTSTPDGRSQTTAMRGAPSQAAQAAPLAPVFVDAPQVGGVAQPGVAPGSAGAQEGADAPGAGSSGAAVPMQGDVFLDGTLVGRWMSRHLSREAGRASAGPTGFDSRRNALLPGATVGV